MQARTCYTRYNEFYKCKAVKSEEDPECRAHQRAYRSLCPGDWVDRWDGGARRRQLVRPILLCMCSRCTCPRHRGHLSAFVLLSVCVCVRTHTLFPSCVCAHWAISAHSFRSVWFSVVCFSADGGQLGSQKSAHACSAVSIIQRQVLAAVTHLLQGESSRGSPETSIETNISEIQAAMHAPALRPSRQMMESQARAMLAILFGFWLQLYTCRPLLPPLVHCCLVGALLQLYWQESSLQAGRTCC